MKELREELKQNRPFRSAEQEALLALQRTAAVFDHAFSEAMKPWGITPTQYNVLRILRGAGDKGLCRHEIGDRMVTRVPDVTRLLDRMEAAGLIERQRDPEDRRQVRTRITAAGLDLLARLDEPVQESEREALGHMSPTDIRELTRLLAVARSSRAL